ncbi:MAG: hypothetical protein JWM91_3276 [Rhodospirillales bacterium]|nr:hypothetical protein [Rhodospirillales bacterium]
MAGQVSDNKSTTAKFVPEDRKGLHKPNSVEWMLMVAGISICGIGSWAVAVGLMIFLGAFYSGFFVKPQVKRGLYFGPCPHCGATMSATHYQDELDCPSCRGMVRVRNGRYEAI